MDIRRLVSDDDDTFDGYTVYEIYDDTLVEGVYYVLIGEREVRIAVITPTGETNIGDMTMLLSRIDLATDEEVDFTSKNAPEPVWTGDVCEILDEVLGPVGSTIVFNDLNGILPDNVDMDDDQEIDTVEVGDLSDDDPNSVTNPTFNVDPSLDKRQIPVTGGEVNS